MSDKHIYIKSYGCQMNVYDSNRIKDLFSNKGYKITNDISKADLTVLNTCHIREKAVEKVYSDIGRVKKIKDKKKNMKLVVAGCVAQAEGLEIKKRSPSVDYVVGPQSYHKLPEMIDKVDEVENSEFLQNEKFKNLIFNSSNLSSEFLSIQEGCDKFCSFCVVPYTRGPEFSRPVNDIVEETKKYVSNGIKEIILLGQNVNAYDNEGYRLSDLILNIEKFSEIKRVRYTTSHPKDMTEDLIEVYKSSKKLMPLVHLPVQSGSNKVLKLMNRKHTIDHYYKIFDKLKAINSNIEFSSDFIIGYPGENEYDFQDTFNLIDKINFINSYSFIFSPRPGTVAENLDLIDKKICMDRLVKVQSILLENQLRMNKSLENKTIDVLVENLTEDKIKAFGRSEYMTSVIFDGKKEDIGKIVSVKIKNSNRSTLFGEIINNSNQRVA